MPIQLPNDVVSIGYKEVRPFHHEQVFQSDSAGFTGTEQEFVAAGHGYEYVQIDAYTRRVVSDPKAVAGASSSLESAFGVSEDDVFLAVSRHGADITTADADALYAVLDAEDRRRIARSALDAGVDLDVQTLAAQEMIATILREKNHLVGEGAGQVRVSLPKSAPKVRAKNLFFALGDSLSNDDTITLYEPVRSLRDGSCISSVTLLRDGMAPFAAGDVKVAEHEGLCFVDAISAPGNQSTYRYLLMKPVAVADRRTCAVRPLAPEHHQSVIGMTKWDRYEVDQEPGRYFVTARKETGETAYLLGPFSHHIDALLLTERAKSHMSETHPDGWWLRYGTVRLADNPGSSLVGKLNDVLLTAEDRVRLSPQAAKPAEAPAPEM